MAKFIARVWYYFDSRAFAAIISFQYWGAGLLARFSGQIIIRRRFAERADFREGGFPGDYEARLRAITMRLCAMLRATKCSWGSALYRDFGFLGLFRWVDAGRRDFSDGEHLAAMLDVASHNARKPPVLILLMRWRRRSNFYAIMQVLLIISGIFWCFMNFHEWWFSILWFFASLKYKYDVKFSLFIRRGRWRGVSMDTSRFISRAAGHRWSCFIHHSTFAVCRIDHHLKACRTQKERW